VVTHGVHCAFGVVGENRPYEHIMLAERAAHPVGRREENARSEWRQPLA
jgi:hypothetical protein